MSSSWPAVPPTSRHRDGAGTALEVGVTPRITAGDVLVVGGFPAPVAVDTVTLTARAALRVDAEEMVAGAYEAGPG